jgi:DNA-directed RNA polymerase subunit RPC12/RpoP
MEKQRLILMVSKEQDKTWIETLAEKVEVIQKNKKLWCPHCAKFTPYKELIFHGKNEKGERISSFNHKDIFEYEGYIYTCSMCGYMNEGMEIEHIEI